MLHPRYHGISMDIAIEWRFRGIIRGPMRAREVRGPKDLNVGLRNIEYVKSDDYFTFGTWMAPGEKMHRHRSGISVLNVDRVRLLENMPQHWGLGLKLLPAPPGGVYLGNRDASTKVVFLYSEDRDLIRQLLYVQENLGAEKLIVILSRFGGGCSFEINMLKKRDIEVCYTTLLLDEDGKPQWELSELEQIKRRLYGTLWDIDLATDRFLFNREKQLLHDDRRILLLTLVKHWISKPGVYLSWQRIAEAYKPDKYYMASNIYKHKSFLMEELDDEAALWVDTKRGEGYRFYPPSK